MGSNPTFRLMRNSCLNCVRKHVAQAIVLLIESRMGYEAHRWLALGHLAESEAESLVDYPELALMINAERKAIEGDVQYNPKLMEIIEEATRLEKLVDKKAKKK